MDSLPLIFLLIFFSSEVQTPHTTTTNTTGTHQKSLWLHVNLLVVVVVGGRGADIVY